MSRRPVEIRRAELIAVGKQVFASRAYDAVSTEELAAAAGISKGLLYHYFENKHGFYLATLASVADDLLAAIPLGPGPLGPGEPGSGEPGPGEPGAGSSPSEILDQAIAGFLDFAEEHTLLLHSLLRGGVGADGAVHTLVEGVREALLARLVLLCGRDNAEDQVSLYGWIGLVEAATLRTLTPGAPPRVSRPQLAALLRARFPFVLEVA